MKFSKGLSATTIAVGLLSASANAECLTYNERVTAMENSHVKPFPVDRISRA